MKGQILFGALAAILLFSIAAIRARPDKVARRVDEGSHFKVLTKAGIPQMINYQGYLTDDGGNAINDTLEMTFNMWDAETDGNQLWGETQTEVPVIDGLFNVLLGSVTPILSSVFSNPACWLQTEIEAEILSPRKELVSVGYAFRADTADFAIAALSDNDWQVVGNCMYSIPIGNVGIGTTSPGTDLHVKDSGTANITIETTSGDANHAGLTLMGGGSNALWSVLTNRSEFTGAVDNLAFYKEQGTIGTKMVITDAGNVGIGTTDPVCPLHVKYITDSGCGIYSENRSASTFTSNAIKGSNHGTPNVGFMQSGGSFSHWGNSNGAKVGVQGFSQGTGGTNYGGYFRAINGSSNYGIWVDGGDSYFEGNVGMGVTSPSEKLDVDGTARLRAMSTGTGTDVVVDGSGVLKRKSSSKRYKRNIRSLEIEPEETLKLQPVRFEWETTGEKDMGLIAEDVQVLIPDLVIYDAEGRPDAVKYDKLAIYLLEMVKAQQKKISNLEKKIEELEKGYSLMSGNKFNISAGIADPEK